MSEYEENEIFWYDYLLNVVWEILFRSWIAGDKDVFKNYLALLTVLDRKSIYRSFDNYIKNAIHAINKRYKNRVAPDDFMKIMTDIKEVVEAKLNELYGDNNNND